MAIINVLLTTFTGLGLPATWAVPLTDSTSVRDLWSTIISRLPQCDRRLVITTHCNKALLPSDRPISTLLANGPNEFLLLRLSTPLRGGKGGFGSQLRAAGGRMSSKRKKNQGDNNGSSRNLDGRRLRTVTEAKALAEYLALKPEMEKKEKEARRKRWQQIVEMAEKKEEEARSGLKGKMDGQWVEDREEAGEHTRHAVESALKSGRYIDNLLVGGSEDASPDEDEAAPVEGRENANQEGSEPLPRPTRPGGAVIASQPQRSKFIAFDDEDDEFFSDDSGDH